MSQTLTRECGDFIQQVCGCYIQQVFGNYIQQLYGNYIQQVCEGEGVLKLFSQRMTALIKHLLNYKGFCRTFPSYTGSVN